MTSIEIVGADFGSECGMNDEQLAPRTDHHRNGTVCAKGYMLGNQLHGDWTWYRIDGTLKRSGHFDHGKQVGEWTTYNNLGIPYKTTQMKAKS
jgi:antitoxin component YwqK of YwqJK toxin-antitoxin module